jgi:hypothetical protein
MVSQDADAIPDGQESRWVLSGIMEELAVAHAHTRNERQFKQWLKEGTPGTTKVKVFKCKKIVFSIAVG